MRRMVKKVLVTLAGGAMLTAGLVMMVTPGPGLVGIVAGLAILATEYAWAARWLDSARARLAAARRVAADTSPRRKRLAVAGVLAVLVAGAGAALVATDLPM